MIFRIAKMADAKEIAKLSIICAIHQKDGFMHKLGIWFMIQYYKSFISEKNSLIIVAEKDGKICGFHSGTLLEEEHQKSISNSKVKFAISLLPQLLLKPSLLIEVLKRYKSLKSDKNSYRVKEGPRGEYWAWLPSMKDPENSLRLHKIWHNIMKEFGVVSVKSEVDMSNKRVVKSIKLMGGIFLDEVTLPDGRKRAIVEYKL